MPRIMINYPPVYCDTHGAFIDECNDANCTWWTDGEIADAGQAPD